MATPIRSLVNALQTPDYRTYLVRCISSILQRLNPQNPNPQNIISGSLNQFNKLLDSDLVIKVIQQQTNPCHALFFFNWASNPNPNPNNYSHTHSCYVAITDVLLSHSLLSTAASLLKNSNKLSDLFISKLIKAYGDRGNVKSAIFWFKQAKKVENGKCLYSYNSILGALVKANRIKLLEGFFYQILEDTVVRPDVSTYTTMIRGYCKMGMIENARKVFDEMVVEPNLVTYNTMINGYCRKGDLESARWISNRMTSSGGCFPDTVTYTTLIDGYCKIGELEEAIKCMDEMVKRGCKPNVLTYNAIIYGLSLRGYVDEANKMITKMRFNGLKDNAATHTSILKGLCVVGKPEEAAAYLKNMITRNMKPDVKAYLVVINGCCKTGNSDEAISLMNEMQARGIKPNVSSFNAVFRTLVEHGDLDRAVLLLKQMPKMGCWPNDISYSTIICNLCMATGRMQEVEELIDVMMRNGHNLDATMYNCMLKGYCEDGNVKMALQNAHAMVIKKYVIDPETFSVLVKLVCVKGKVTEAEKLLEMCLDCPVYDIHTSNYRRILELFRMEKDNRQRWDSSPSQFSVHSPDS